MQGNPSPAPLPRFHLAAGDDEKQDLHCRLGLHTVAHRVQERREHDAQHPHPQLHHAQYHVRAQVAAQVFPSSRVGYAP